mmetsp:Transcript_1734/g.4926  ORF Transcript_1734/g.4926 Transcript_1734/m.4926 type:complete len:217 (+) Transcript_1734:3401-4051(+)
MDGQRRNEHLGVLFVLLGVLHCLEDKKEAGVERGVATDLHDRRTVAVIDRSHPKVHVLLGLLVGPVLDRALLHVEGKLPKVHGAAGCDCLHLAVLHDAVFEDEGAWALAHRAQLVFDVDVRHPEPPILAVVKVHRRQGEPARAGLAAIHARRLASLGGVKRQARVVPNCNLFAVEADALSELIDATDPPDFETHSHVFRGVGACGDGHWFRLRALA